MVLVEIAGPAPGIVVLGDTAELGLEVLKPTATELPIALPMFPYASVAATLNVAVFLEPKAFNVQENRQLTGPPLVVKEFHASLLMVAGDTAIAKDALRVPSLTVNESEPAFVSVIGNVACPLDQAGFAGSVGDALLGLLAAPLPLHVSGPPV